MSSNKSTLGKSSGADPLVLGALYFLELSMLLVMLTAYVFPRKSSLVSFLFSRPGYVFISGVLGIVVSGAMIAYRYLQSQKQSLRRSS